MSPTILAVGDDFASTTANKTIDIKINGNMFVDDFVLGPGNGSVVLKIKTVW